MLCSFHTTYTIHKELRLETALSTINRNIKCIETRAECVVRNFVYSAYFSISSVFEKLFRHGFKKYVYLGLKLLLPYFKLANQSYPIENHVNELKRDKFISHVSGNTSQDIGRRCFPRSGRW